MISYGQIFEAGTQYKIFYKEILQSYLKPQENFFSFPFYFYYKVQAEIYMSCFLNYKTKRDTDWE